MALWYRGKEHAKWFWEWGKSLLPASLARRQALPEEMTFFILQMVSISMIFFFSSAVKYRKVKVKLPLVQNFWEQFGERYFRLSGFKQTLKDRISWLNVLIILIISLWFFKYKFMIFLFPLKIVTFIGDELINMELHFIDACRVAFWDCAGFCQLHSETVQIEVLCK